MQSPTPMLCGVLLPFHNHRNTSNGLSRAPENAAGLPTNSCASAALQQQLARNARAQPCAIGWCEWPRFGTPRPPAPCHFQLFSWQRRPSPQPPGCIPGESKHHPARAAVAKAQAATGASRASPVSQRRRIEAGISQLNPCRDGPKDLPWVRLKCSELNDHFSWYLLQLHYSC